MAISISGNGRTAFGPAITRDGLILYLDAANTKSFKGEPTTNELVITPQWGGDGAGQNALVITDESLKYNGYETTLWTPGTSNNTYLVGGNLSAARTSTVWTFSCYIKREDGVAITSLNVYMYYPNSDGSAAGTIQDVSNGWYRISRTRTGSDNYLSLVGFTGFVSGKKYYLSGAQLEKKPYPTTYVRANTSRGTTVATGGGWADLTTNAYHGQLVNGTMESTLGRSSLSFDGIDDYISLASPSSRWEWSPSGSGLNTMTIDLWIKTSDTGGTIISKPWNGNGEYNYQIGSNSWYHRLGNQQHTQNFTSVATGNWENVTCIVTPTQKAVYRNGVLNAGFVNHSITNNVPEAGNGSIVLSLMTLYPYGTPFNQTGFSILGNMGLFRIYNRILSASEIANNYRAGKSRFVN